MKTTERTPQQLIGKIVYFFRTAGAHHGCRRGKVIGGGGGSTKGIHRHPRDPRRSPTRSPTDQCRSPWRA